MRLEQLIRQLSKISQQQKCQWHMGSVNNNNYICELGKIIVVKPSLEGAIKEVILIADINNSNNGK